MIILLYFIKLDVIYLFKITVYFYMIIKVL